MKPLLKIGTRESELAVWQATQVQVLLRQQGIASKLVFISSEGDVDLITPLYKMGVEGIFTKALDSALLNHRIDIAVHSMKDVPVQLPQGIRQAAVLERGSHKDVLVYRDSALIKDWEVFAPSPGHSSAGIIATSSIRRRAQWLHYYPGHIIENLRGNINTRLRKVYESKWSGAIFAAAGLERINLRPENAVDLGWMLPAPAQGAIMVVCRHNDDFPFDACRKFNHRPTELCTKIERDFLEELSGGCSTPVSALAQISDSMVFFKGNICSPDGKQKVEIDMKRSVDRSSDFGTIAARELLQKRSATDILQEISDAKS